MLRGLEQVVHCAHASCQCSNFVMSGFFQFDAWSTFVDLSHIGSRVGLLAHCAQSRNVGWGALGALRNRSCPQDSVCVAQLIMDNFDNYIPGDDFMSDYLGSLTSSVGVDVSALIIGRVLGAV